jgi:hypothetical protein
MNGGCLGSKRKSLLGKVGTTPSKMFSLVNHWTVGADEKKRLNNKREKKN